MMNLDQIDDFYRAHGYIRMSESLPGEDADFLQFHRAGVCNIARAMERNRAAYRLRGRSQRALEMLHTDLPNPVWGVEVCDV